MKKAVSVLFNAITTTQTSFVTSELYGPMVVEAMIAGTGAVSATVQWYGNTDNSTTNGVLIATSTLSGTTSDNTGAPITAEWPFVFAILSAISGTGAAVTAKVAG